MDFSFLKSKKVLITGNTGFKGSWLTEWLLLESANIIGYANSIPTDPSMFKALNHENRIEQFWGDIRDLSSVNNLIKQEQPEIIFHLAAQPLVQNSYDNPVETIETNAIGTLNILEAVRRNLSSCIIISITSDKVYDNVEWDWGYRESDAIGGRDPYSASKAAAECILKTYFHSFFKDSDINLGIVRAGNVIGGGDWAKDRITPDAVRAWSNDQMLTIRNPSSTRPWQHVLEPLGGYISLAKELWNNKDIDGEAFNFGPPMSQNASVLELVTEMKKYWDSAAWEIPNKVSNARHEAKLLKLNCDKALHRINWSPKLTFDETVKMTALWYKTYYENEGQISSLTKDQINEYISLNKSL